MRKHKTVILCALLNTCTKSIIDSERLSSILLSHTTNPKKTASSNAFKEKEASYVWWFWTTQDQNLKICRLVFILICNVPVNSQTAHTSPPPPHPPPPRAYPRHLYEYYFITWAIWPIMRPIQSGIWLLCQNTGQHHKQKDFVILSAFSMCTGLRGHCSSIHCFVGAFESFSKSPLNVCFLELTILLKWTLLCKTAFQDLQYFGCVK